MDNYILSPIQIDKLKAELSDELISKLLPHLHTIQTAIPADSKLLSRRQAADFLEVSLVTLSEWTKQDIIQSYRISTSIRYKKHELENALKSIRFK
jgi:hypothetical protein